MLSQYDALPISNGLVLSPLDFNNNPVLADFKELTGISSNTVVNGQGIVTWLIEDSKGVCRRLSTKTYLVRDAGIRLFSPQTYFQENRNSSNDPHY